MSFSPTFFTTSLLALSIIFSVCQVRCREYSFMITVSGLCLSLSKECKVFILFLLVGDFWIQGASRLRLVVWCRVIQVTFQEYFQITWGVEWSK